MATSTDGEDSESGTSVVLTDDSEGDETRNVPITRSRARGGVRRVFFEDTSYSDDTAGAFDESSSAAPTEAQSRVLLSSDGEEDVEPSRRKRRKKEQSADTTLVADDDEANCCSVCFEEYTNAGAHRLVSLKCGHIFGQCCIERWIRSEKNAKCPQCKTRARISDMRRIFARTVKMIDTTQLEELRESLKAYKAENDSLRLEIVQLKLKLKKVEEAAATSRAASSSAAVATAKNVVPHEFSLSPERTVVLSAQPGSRSVHEDGNMFVVTCRIDNDLFMPYGLKLLSFKSDERCAANDFR
ncbi:unnamed protein product [Toxocara canis]|uniref:RING-type domain-containing protein n=1 Tax=Toxocara canis TaxID=6265 RepID=A0A183U3I4_TOXCA|nr:unnamed protein product [Toxocara canis]